ncbi:rhodanese-like domain-containing protein [Candidatus Berkiella cookevillensis]|uniref:Inner membrane protein YgaP n=1 Tax=Candidatus Berkiella cookevillensis TaxID=437022 RepID=A0A0Q9YSN6_9GAMM|nr:rhodanese-like domain-containing protein [Candidatus Berkiella cookevillensis]MCS5707652.1 rhodanese-like domain-containing protein [Candidatus Berkiella cookevillensis]
MTSFSIILAENLCPVDPKQGIILDVRTKMEHAEKHIGFSHAHVPLDELKPTELMVHHGLAKNAEVYILCRSGKRASQAAEKFIAEGYCNVKVIEGGITACEMCGHDIKGYGTQISTTQTKLKKPISLERQVRIAAGLFVTLGAALALFISPLFSIIPLFVGCGLIFAGITDRCGMALILTKAPWNKTKDSFDTTTLPR